MNASTLTPTPKRATDAELAEDRERHGGAAAHVMATSRLSAYYSAVLLACEEAADRWRRGGAP